MQLLKKTVKSAKMNKIFELLSCSQGAIASLKLFGHVTATTRPKCALHTETTCVLGFRARSKPCIFAWKCSEHEDMRRSTVTMTRTSEIVTFRFSRLYPSFPKTMSSKVSLRPRISPNNSLQHSWKRKGMVGEDGREGLVEKACTCFDCVQDLYMTLNSLSWHQTGKTGYCEENRLKPVSDRISGNK